jgi:hypothetical protein
LNFFNNLVTAAVAAGLGLIYIKVGAQGISFNKFCVVALIESNLLGG